MTTDLRNGDLTTLTNEMTYLRYSMNRDYLQKVFCKIPVADYLIMMMLTRRMGLHEPEAKIYLSEISDEMRQPIQKVSKIVQNLRDKGLVYWKHDGKGEQGTYIVLSEAGMEAIKEQQQILKEYYKRVIERLGHDRFVEILEMIKELEIIMDDEGQRL